jgi:hypothetical protein
MSDLIKFPSHYTSGCSILGKPIVEAILDELGNWIDCEWGFSDDDWQKECKDFCVDIEMQLVTDFCPPKRPLHQLFSAIEYLWRAGLKDGESALQPLLKAQERLKIYPEFGAGTIVGEMLAKTIADFSPRTESIVCPNCGAIELATVITGILFDSYFHKSPRYAGNPASSDLGGKRLAGL